MTDEYSALEKCGNCEYFDGQKCTRASFASKRKTEDKKCWQYKRSKSFINDVKKLNEAKEKGKQYLYIPLSVIAVLAIIAIIIIVIVLASSGTFTRNKIRKQVTTNLVDTSYSYSANNNSINTEFRDGYGIMETVINGEKTRILFDYELDWKSKINSNDYELVIEITNKSTDKTIMMFVTYDESESGYYATNIGFEEGSSYVLLYLE